MRFVRAIRVPTMRLPYPPAGRWNGPVRRFIELPGPKLVVGCIAVGGAALVAAGIVFFAAERALGSQADGRAGAEATSFAEHSGVLATGDAFAGYINMLRAAEDPEVRAVGIPSDRRTAALRRLLELNTNRFSGYAVIGLDGQLVAATDLSLVDAPASEAFASVRASQGNANSDIVFAPGVAPHVDYATVLTDPNGAAWGALLARADVERLWQPTLAASIDDGTNIIISRDGLMASGVPEEQVGTPWRGSAFAGGAVRTDVIGADSICGLHAIARDTKIDHGWNVASCLPVTTVLGSGSQALQLGLIGLLAVICAAVLATAIMLFLTRDAGPAVEAVPPLETEAVIDEPPAFPEPLLQVPPPPNVDARTLIEAYEARNARLAGHIRESVQARLLVVSSRVEEALQLAEDDPELSHAMLRRAALELDDMNEHELRALGQELYPDLVRLGLPAALRALRKDVSDTIEVDVDVDGDSDTLDEDSGYAIDSQRRIVLYRLALETLQAFSAGGLEASTVSLKRAPDTVWLAVKGHGHSSTSLEQALRASVVSVEAYGGTFTLDAAGDATEIAAELPPNDHVASFPSNAATDVAEAAAQDDSEAA